MSKSLPTPSRKAPKLETPRVRFNWGFHDGADAAKRGLRGNGFVTDMTKHQDRVYAAGVAAGRKAASDGEYTDNTLSDAAWQAYKA